MTAPLASELENILPNLSLPPLEFHLVEHAGAGSGTSIPILESIGNRVPGLRFSVEYRRQWTPAMLRLAVANAREKAERTNTAPLVVLPYLSEERLLELEAEGVSGLDLCGNGVVTGPGGLTIFRSGKPNRFTSSAPIKNIFRGATSLVPRAFLQQESFPSVAALRETLRTRRCLVSASTVSKALNGLEDEILLDRGPNGLTLLQPEKLIHLLETNYTPPTARLRIIGRVEMPLPELRTALAQTAQTLGLPLAGTGETSAERYAPLSNSDRIAVYCGDAGKIADRLRLTPTDRFANLALIETVDPVAYADTRLDSSGFAWASPIQSFLEMAHAEPRLRQMAAGLRDAILQGLHAEGNPRQ